MLVEEDHGASTRPQGVSDPCGKKKSEKSLNKQRRGARGGNSFGRGVPLPQQPAFGTDPAGRGRGSGPPVRPSTLGPNRQTSEREDEEMGMPMGTASSSGIPQMAPPPELPATAPNDGWMRINRRTEKRGVEVEGGMNKRTAPALPTGPPHAIGPATLPAPPPPLPNGQPGEYLGGRVLPEGEFWKIFPVIQVLNYTEPTRTPNTQRISIDRKTAMGNPFIHNNTQG